MDESAHVLPGQAWPGLFAEYSVDFRFRRQGMKKRLHEPQAHRLFGT
jgi:hypothetical protein